MYKGGLSPFLCLALAKSAAQMCTRLAMESRLDVSANNLGSYPNYNKYEGD